MNWKIWKVGFFIAVLTGLLSGLAAYQVADHIILDRFIMFILASIAKDALLYLKSHPAPIDP